MKKPLFAAGLALLLGMTVSCSGNKENQENAANADTAAVAEAAEPARSAEQMRLDSLRQDSVMNAEIDAEYAKGITLTEGKKSSNWIPESSGKVVKWPLTLINNTGIVLSPKDYTITYTETAEKDVNGELRDVTKKRTMEGPELQPGQPSEVTINKTMVLDITKPKVKLTISKEEFAARYKESKKK